jgi:hypothetical protein
VKGGNKYLTMRKAKHLGFFTQIVFFSLVYLCWKLSRGMSEALILNRLLIILFQFTTDMIIIQTFVFLIILIILIFYFM